MATALNQFPTDNSAVLIEQFNGESGYDRLLTIYEDELRLPEIDQAGTFRATWQRLRQSAQTRRQKQRLGEIKAQSGALSDEEIATRVAQIFA